MTLDGDRGVLDRLPAALDRPEPDFPIVTPWKVNRGRAWIRVER
ncbi:hypothetical protein [Paractinoplanes globisporus]|uniref:Uncharacterized protein n=1 Tax=Paractinoplanes globisporus TaxID=113565 RepID=A0ABW6WW74_9ACTN|nr:hypothetical protein [Actinoplanes globisporus]